MLNSLQQNCYGQYRPLLGLLHRQRLQALLQRRILRRLVAAVGPIPRDELGARRLLQHHVGRHPVRLPLRAHLPRRPVSFFMRNSYCTLFLFFCSFICILHLFLYFFLW